MRITKKIWAIIMAVTLLVSSVSFNAYAENASGSCGSNVSWLFNAETGELIISGTGSMADYSAETAPWKDYNDKITNVVVEEGITALWTNNRSQPFNGITQRFTVSLPSTLEKIERDFNSCTNLTAVTFPEKGVLEKVDGWAFSGCSSLESIVFPNNAKTKFYDGSFNNCYALTSVVLGNKTDRLDGRVFNNCRALTEIVIPASVVQVGNALDVQGPAFNGCSGLSKITFLSSNTKIMPSDAKGIPENVSIYGIKGSSAEIYAQTYDRNFGEIKAEFYDESMEDPMTQSTAKNIVAIDKAYIRGGDWANKNWHTINAERKAQGLISTDFMVIKNGDGDGMQNSSYTRIALFKYDISSLTLDDIGYATITLKFTDMDTSKDIPFDFYWVDENWDGSTVTWNTKPSFIDSEPVIEGVLVNSDVKKDATYALKCLVASGKKTVALMVVQTVSATGESRISLTKANELSFPYFTVVKDASAKNDTYVKKLVEDTEENQYIWDYAKQVFDDWYGRYEVLKNTPLVDAELIVSDESQYTKTNYSPGSDPKAEFNEYKTRTYGALTDMSEYVDVNEKVRFNRYGGIMDEALRQTPTGFFHTKKIDGRWWVIDPLGYPCYIRALSGVVYSYQGSPQQKAATLKQYETTEKWALATTRHLMNDLYFNACASPSDEIKTVINGLAWQSGVAFGSLYGEHIGVNNSNGGYTTFSENNTMPIFDPEFVTFCDEIASARIAPSATESRFLGWTLGNELPMNVDMIHSYMTISPAKSVNYYSYACTWYWLTRMTGKENPTRADVTDELAQLFRGFVWDRYYNVTCSAVRKYDPNHMIIGSRFLTIVKDAPWVLRFSAEYLDCITVNWYGQWEPEAMDIYSFAVNADVPFMVTEFYAKAEENEGNLANKDGAGFFVKTQQDRGDFYQSFTLRLLEAKNCIGWHWFQYADNDPTGKTTDASSRDANKGIVSNTHKEYTDLTDDMAEINKNVYSIIKYFDAKYAK